MNVTSLQLKEVLILQILALALLLIFEVFEQVKVAAQVHIQNLVLNFWQEFFRFDEENGHQFVSVIEMFRIHAVIYVQIALENFSKREYPLDVNIFFLRTLNRKFQSSQQIFQISGSFFLIFVNEFLSALHFGAETLTLECGKRSKSNFFFGKGLRSQ